MSIDSRIKPVTRGPAGSLFSFSQRLDRTDASLLLMLSGGSILLLSVLPSTPFIVWEAGLIIFGLGSVMLFTGDDTDETKPQSN
jgi:hypothetical protein